MRAQPSWMAANAVPAVPWGMNPVSHEGSSGMAGGWLLMGGSMDDGSWALACSWCWGSKKPSVRFDSTRF